MRNADKDDIHGLKRKIVTPVLSVEEKTQIRRYFGERVKRLQVVKSTVTPSGQVLDWIPIESQHREKKIAAPPAKLELRLPHQEKGRVEFSKFELEKPGVERGPEGTVPVLRKDVKSIRFNKNLDDFLSKHGHKTRTLQFDQGASIEEPESGGPHDYAYTSQSVTCYGGEGWISAYDPYTNYSDEFSLGQIALVRNSNKGMQTLEAGHQEYRDLYGDWVPHLFVYYTTNGYSSNGDNVGGYNRDVDGWVQYSSSIYPGATSSPTSTPGGAQFVLHIKYQLWQGNWWLACNGHWIGYYPASLFAPEALRSQADRVDFYGEIVDSGSHSSATKTDMGSGYWAEYRWPYSGFMCNLLYQYDSAGHMKNYSAGSVWATDTKEYDVEAHMNSGSSWDSYFWFGGPGAG